MNEVRGCVGGAAFVGNTHVTENTASSLLEPSSSGEKMRNVVGLRLMTSLKNAKGRVEWLVINWQV